MHVEGLDLHQAHALAVQYEREYARRHLSLLHQMVYSNWRNQFQDAAYFGKART